MFDFRKKKNQENRKFTMPEGLTRDEQKAVKEAIKKARKNDGTPRTAQQSIPFDRMFPDGICRVGLDYYTKTIQFQDINYQLAQQEDKTEIFEEWCSFLNFFDSSINFQLSFNNMATDVSDFEKSIAIAHKKDGFDDVRDEYSEVLLHQMEAGNNGLTKTKYLTFGIHAESMKTAKPRLIHIETDILNNFKRLGVRAKTLNGSERLELMHRQFHMGDDAKFHFDWKYLAGSGLSVKDFIAPSSFAFPTGRYFQMGDMYGCMSFLSIDASDISDRLLADFLSMESSQIVTMHIKSVDQNEAIKTIKHTITELDRSKIEEQKKAVRAGYDMDIIPSDLATYGKDAKALLKELQSQNERMFLLTFLVMNTGRTKQELENNVFQAVSIAQKHNCNLVRLDYQQEQGLMSTLPLASNLIEIQRGMTTSSTAIFVPFTTQELFQNGKEALYYGLNALSNNMIMVDRKKLKNPKHKKVNGEEPGAELLKTSYSFMDAANLLGIHNSNLYEIWRRENLETITVDSVKRIPVDVFERWYENQIMYQKADRMPTLTDLEADYIPLQEAAGLLGITKEKLSVITRASRYKDIFEIRVYDNKKWISKKSFQQFLNAQNVYQVIKEPEKEMPTSEESMETKEFISRQEAAALAGVTSATITKWVQLERFPCVGAGRVLRIYRKEFLKWLKKYREGGV